MDYLLQPSIKDNEGKALEAGAEAKSTKKFLLTALNPGPCSATRLILPNPTLPGVLSYRGLGLLRKYPSDFPTG